jgi:hypothetical protein
MTLARREALSLLFEDVVMPVYKLFQMMGEAPADLSTLAMAVGGE